MIRIAVLGDIGSGKSYVAKQFGYPVFNADAEVVRLYRKSRKCYSKLKKIIPNYILEQQKGYRESIRKRNTYAEVLNILQADIMKKLYKNKIKIKNKKILTDAMLVTIAGIAAAMKNVG